VALVLLTFLSIKRPAWHRRKKAITPHLEIVCSISGTMRVVQWKWSLDFLCIWTVLKLNTAQATEHKQADNRELLYREMYVRAPCYTSTLCGTLNNEAIQRNNEDALGMCNKTWTCNWFHQFFLKPRLIQCCKSQMIYELNCYEPEGRNSNFTTGRWALNVDGEKAIALKLFDITCRLCTKRTEEC